MVHRSNLFRKPNIPEFDKVHESFVARGGTKEMADSFFQKHASTGWYLRGSPITNFINLVPSFIENWRKNEQRGAKKTENYDYAAIAALNKKREDEAWAAITGDNAPKQPRS
ncbi:MAG TPA: hypothetical protein PLS00_09010, partial [Niabella sp.]|nr:hypothetical protein [Niabella sp.]